nr:hypothetical protein [Anaerolineae bacterium]
MDGFVYIPFWRSGTWEDITYRTQIYLAPLNNEPVSLGMYLYENGGRPWAGKTFAIEIDRHQETVTTDRNGMIEVQLRPGQVCRVEIHVVDHEYGTGEIHLLSGSKPIRLLARGDLEVFAAESSGFEMSVSEISITGGQPVVLDPPGR